MALTHILYLAPKENVQCVWPCAAHGPEGKGDSRPTYKSYDGMSGTAEGQVMGYAVWENGDTLECVERASELQVVN